MARTGFRAAFGWVMMVSAVAFLAACGLLPPRGEPSRAGVEPDRGTEEGRASMQPEAGRFEEPGELDRMLDAKPLPFPAVKPVAMAGSAAPVKAAPEASSGRGRFRIQVAAENDIDAAQAKKVQLERLIGGTVDVVFDAPYYKLRWGFFETKQDADDKILELTEHKIQGFVVKQ